MFLFFSADSSKKCLFSNTVYVIAEKQQLRKIAKSFLTNQKLNIPAAIKGRLTFNWEVAIHSRC